MWNNSPLFQQVNTNRLVWKPENGCYVYCLCIEDIEKTKLLEWYMKTESTFKSQELGMADL